MKTTQFSKRSKRSLGTAACLGVLSGSMTLLLLQAPAWAQEPSPADTAAARELAIDGIKLADAEHCAQAIDKLDRAEKLRHSPIVLGRLGECRIQVGKYVEGIEDLQRLLHETPPPNPPATLVRARERAQVAVDAARPNLSYLAISVSGPGENISVTLDGQPVSTLLLDRERPTDPGEHFIEATAPGYTKATRRLTIGTGEKQEVTLRLTLAPQATEPHEVAVGKSPDVATVATPATAAPTPTEPAQPDKPEASSSSGARTLSYVLLGVGAATAATGGVFGYLALKNKQDLDGKCPSNTCVSSSKGTLDAANRNATVSTVLVGSGAAALALGTIIYFVSSPSEREKPPSTGVNARAYVGLAQAGILGSF